MARKESVRFAGNQLLQTLMMLGQELQRKQYLQQIEGARQAATSPVQVGAVPVDFSRPNQGGVRSVAPGMPQDSIATQPSPFPVESQFSQPEFLRSLLMLASGGNKEAERQIPIQSAFLPKPFSHSPGQVYGRQDPITGQRKIEGQVPFSIKPDRNVSYQTVLDEDGNPKRVGVVTDELGGKVNQFDVGPSPLGGAGGGNPYFTFLGYTPEGKAAGWNTRTGRVEIQDMPGGQPTIGRQFEALPPKAQEDLTFGFQGLEQLDMMEKAIDKASRVTGPLEKLTVWTGAGSKEATDFVTARKNYRLSVQAMIKGIPSNFDVEIATDVIPDLDVSNKEAKSLLEYQKKVTKHIVKSVLAYYMGTNKIIPDYVKNQARKHGIDINRVKEWDGQSDPILKDFPEPPKRELTDEDKQAIEWAKKNLQDPRARRILDLHGAQ